MPAFPFKISKAEIEKLSYERYVYPQPVVQKRIFAVYLKMEFNYTNRLIGLITGLHYNMVQNIITTQSNSMKQFKVSLMESTRVLKKISFLYCS
jgi:hypothetical protein